MIGSAETNRVRALAANWCGHREKYTFVAILCGPRGHSDRLMSCTVCDRRYFGADLQDILSHERDRENERTGSMSVPIVEPGNKEAATIPDEKHKFTEEMGPGHVMGNLTMDPELRFTPTGRPTARVRIAYTPRTKLPDNKGWQDEPTEFYDIIVWGDQAQRVAEYLVKGDRVVAAGTFTKRFWQDKKGEDRETIELTARDIGPSLLFHGAQPLRKKPGNGGNGNEGK